MTKDPNHIDLRSLALRSAVDNGFSPNMGLDVLNEVKTISKGYEEIVRSQSYPDLRALLWSSIDNTESRDLDQIEFAEMESNGDMRVMVAIADVDAFVPKGSAIDIHAGANTTSVYTGIVTFPMLPVELSNEITSLNQNADRLAIIMDLVAGPDGAIKSSKFYRAKVRNHAKLAYSAVGKWFDGESDTPAKDLQVEGLEDQLYLQRKESERFQALRQRGGSLNLETIEATPVTVDGNVVDIKVIEDNPARELIENFMIASNSSMALYLEHHGSLSLRRIVKTPKRWSRIVEIAAQLKEFLPDHPDPKALSEFLRKRKEADPVHFPDLSLTIVKLLGPGEYTVVRAGEQHEGHFGLGIHDYTHATAPNRRYADLITQRLIKSLIDGKPCPYTEQELSTIAEHCTERENAANKVERYMRKAAAAVLLSKRIGEKFEAIVTGVTPDGTYVRTIKPSAEGRVIEGESQLDVGDRTIVELVATDPIKGFIDFKKV